MTYIESGYPVCLPERKEEVKSLLLTAARKKRDVKYPQMYRIFAEEKEQDVSPLTWRHSVWITVEEVCNEISTPAGAIYYSLLSNKKSVPENEFIEIVYRYRKHEYEKVFDVSLPNFCDFDYELKCRLIQFERSRVYRHVEIHHGT